MEMCRIAIREAEKHAYYTGAPRMSGLRHIVRFEDELDQKALESIFLSLDLLQIREDMDKLLVKIKSLSLGY
jgi:hypothetical protein